MLVELRQVEVYIEPNDILTQALEEGDISVDRVIQECITEEGVETILDAVDNDDIREYVEKYGLDLEINTTLDQVTKAVIYFNQTEKAKLLWLLLRCEDQ